MRDILKMSLTLAMVAALSASLLTGVHNITEPVILERQEREYYEAIERFFPAVEDFQTKEIDSNQYDLIYDQDGEELGVMGTIETQGYDGAIRYNLAVDAEGVIQGIVIVSHTETPGIGDVIETDQFQEQFVGKGYDDPLEDGEDVDTVSGATLSTGAMLSSIRRTVNTIAEQFLGEEREYIDVSEIPDGVYEASVDGTHGVLTVEVEVENGEIVRVDVPEQNETEAYFVDSYPEIPERIVEEQRVEVDTQTGATLTAERIVDAVKKALADAAPEIEDEAEDNGGDNNNEGE